MTPRLFCVTVIEIAVLASACGRRTAALAPSASLREDETQYKQGLAAFHEGTPEGYARAADAFRKASALKPRRCDYALNLAQSLLFLSAEQLLNWEEYGPHQTEAIAVVDSTSSTCMSSYEPFLLRLRALIAGRGPTATDLINRAVDLDASDAMNWLVLGYLDPASRHLATTEGSGKRAAMAHVVELEPDSALLRYELGKNYQSLRGKESDAKRAFERAIELSPRHFRAYLGLAYLADENVDVEPLYKKVVEIAPAFLEGRTALGSYYGAVDEIEKAAEQYTGGLETNHRDDIAHFRLGL